MPQSFINIMWFNIGSDTGLVLSGNKPLPEPMLTLIYVAKWRHLAKMSLKYLNSC